MLGCMPLFAGDLTTAGWVGCGLVALHVSCTASPLNLDAVSSSPNCGIGT